jgi:hypothetical protein
MLFANVIARYEAISQVSGRDCRASLAMTLVERRLTASQTHTFGIGLWRDSAMSSKLAIALTASQTQLCDS